MPRALQGVRGGVDKRPLLEFNVAAVNVAALHCAGAGRKQNSLNGFQVSFPRLFAEAFQLIAEFLVGLVNVRAPLGKEFLQFVGIFRFAPGVKLRHQLLVSPVIVRHSEIAELFREMAFGAVQLIVVVAEQQQDRKSRNEPEEINETTTHNLLPYAKLPEDYVEYLIRRLLSGDFPNGSQRQLQFFRAQFQIFSGSET